MTARNCPLCGRLFDYSSQFPVCPDCFTKYEEDFRKVREYLYDNPNQNAVEVSEATGVPMDRIKAFLREERLVAVNNQSSALLDCKRCGKPILLGNYCAECQKAIDMDSRKSQSHYAGDDPNRGGKLHSKYIDKKR